MMFSVVLITIDRSPKRNYLLDTLCSLNRSGVFDSPLLESFHIIDSGSESLDFVYDALEVSFAIEDPHKGIFINRAPRRPTENAAYALKRGAEQGGEWVIFLEDDIDVCDKFLESVAGWLDDHAEGYRFFPLGANYDHLESFFQQGKTSWIYPIGMYYGTLAITMRRADAAAISDYLLANTNRQEYDLLIAEWARMQGIEHFLTPVPSFVQHTGQESVIRPGSIFHTYSSWQGPSWSYTRKDAPCVR